MIRPLDSLSPSPDNYTRHMESAMEAQTNKKQLKLGIVGIGVGASEILPAMEQMPEFKLVAAADINPRVLETFRQRYGAKTYDSIEKMCADPDVEAVWVSTPNKFHAPHTIIAANAGKHVVVEKPMAISLKEAEQMIEASLKNKIKLLCGHTQSFGPHIRTMRRIICSGELGRLCAMHVWAYTEWMLRPRTAEELDINQGGGIPYRQGPHQIDTLRLLGGGLVRSVRGSTGQWFKGRPIPGYYSAFLEFENGVPATLMHNGYGYFLASELVPWGGQNSRYSEAERAAIRKSLLDGTRNENADKDEMRIGGAHRCASHPCRHFHCACRPTMICESPLAPLPSTGCFALPREQVRTQENNRSHCASASPAHRSRILRMQNNSLEWVCP